MNIEEARKKVGMSRKEVSEKLEIPYRTISGWENGERSCPSYIEKLVVEKILTMKQKYLLNNERVRYKSMKSYKNYEKEFIGCSDIASLILAGIGEGDKGLELKKLCFGEDGLYHAYIVDENAEIGSHYNKVATFTHWLKIYDDDSLVKKFRGEEINIYTAGNKGCIIQIINGKLESIK